jgi:hypothetical protein
VRKNPATVSRRNLILILLAGFVLALGAAGAAQRDADQGRSTTTSPPAAPPPSGGGTQANLVKGELPADKVVRAAVGDDVELRVASSSPDVAKILALGVQTAVGPGIPGTLRFEALSAGRFPVDLELGGVAGEVVVSEPGERQAPGSAP